jgi:hypothetical protein
MYLANNNPVREAITGKDYFAETGALAVIPNTDSVTISRSNVSSNYEVSRLHIQAGPINLRPFLNNSSIYKLIAHQAVIFEFSCNSDKKESETEKSLPEGIENLLGSIFGIDANVIAADEPISASVLELRTGKEIWQYFLLIALIFLAIEFYLSRSLMKSQ